MISMGFQAWLRQVQEKFCCFCKQSERPGDIEQNNSSPLDEESLPSPMLPCPCACQKRWDVSNLRLPSPYLLPGGGTAFYVTECLPLYKATLNGDWKGMKRIVSINDKTILRSSLTQAHETALHVAVGTRHAAIVQKLVELMEPQDLELQDGRGNTVFCAAVAMGNVEIAKILMQKRGEVVLMRGALNKTPLYIALTVGDPEMIRFVYQNFGQHIDHLNEDELQDIFLSCIHASVFDLAINMLRLHPDLAWARNAYGEAALGILARKPSAFVGKSPTRLTKLVSHVGFNAISMRNEALELTKLLCEKMSSDKRKSFEEIVAHISDDEILFKAAKLGNDKFLAVLIGYYPDLVFRRDDEHKRSIFHIAVLHRHANTFKLIHNLGLQKDVLLRYTVTLPDDTDEENDIILYNMLHLAAKLPSLDRLSTVSGAALQMQLELLWFKEVENLSPTSERERRDSRYKLTPRELFRKEHDGLRKDGEQWMRSTAGSGMVVATLITTVAFTAASTLPGGNKEPDGSPANIAKVMFHVFMVSDAVAMCSSIISALMFLFILTSRYAQEDFRFRLPLKLLAGFTALFLSMMTLMVSFAAMFFLAYEKENLISAHKSKLTWVPYLVAAISSLPIISFVMLENKYFCDVFRSTFCSKCLFRPGLRVTQNKQLSNRATIRATRQTRPP